MTQRMTSAEYKQSLLGQDTVSHGAGKRTTKQKHELALVVLLKRLHEELAIPFGGDWKAGMVVEPGHSYREYLFSQRRRFRADLAIPSLFIILEIHGGAYVPRFKKDGTFCGYGGGHHSKEGRRRDIEKSNLANLEGWTYLESEWSDVEDGTAFDWLAEAIRGNR